MELEGDGNPMNESKNSNHKIGIEDEKQKSL